MQADPVDGIPALVAALVGKQFDRVFNILHGQRGGGEDGVVQGLLEAFGIPLYRFRRARLGTLDGQDPHEAGVDGDGPADAALSHAGRTMAAAAGLIGLPVVVKPSNEGSSVRRQPGEDGRAAVGGGRAGPPVSRRAADGDAD